MSTQLPQASASTNSAIRAVSSVADEESQETVLVSRAEQGGVKFQTRDFAEPIQEDGVGNQTSKAIPTARDLVRQQRKLKELREKVHTTIPWPEPQAVPAYLAFQCVEIDMSVFCTGVYLLLRDNVVVYVGSSVEVICRIAHHRSGYERKDFHRAIYLPCLAEDRLDIEGALIRFFCPEYNSVRAAPQVTDDDDRIRRMLKLPTMHPELRKLYREKMKLKKMNAARFPPNRKPRTP